MRVWGPYERARAAASGAATPSGALPIVDVESLVAAARSIHRAPTQRQFQLLTHVARRAREIGVSTGTWSPGGPLVARLRDPLYQPYDRHGFAIEVGAEVDCYQSLRRVDRGRVSGFVDDRVMVASAGKLVRYRASDIVTITTEQRAV